MNWKHILAKTNSSSVLVVIEAIKIFRVNSSAVESQLNIFQLNTPKHQSQKSRNKIEPPPLAVSLSLSSSERYTFRTSVNLSLSHSHTDQICKFSGLKSIFLLEMNWTAQNIEILWIKLPATSFYSGNSLIRPSFSDIQWNQISHLGHQISAPAFENQRTPISPYDTIHLRLYSLFKGKYSN